jgi:hypothetical protein
MSNDVFAPKREKILMKRLAVVLSLVVCTWMLTPTPKAQALSWSSWWSSWWSNSEKTSKRSQGNEGRRGSNAGSAVPELDPSAAGSAMVLLLGAMALIASRRREDDLA